MNIFNLFKRAEQKVVSYIEPTIKDVEMNLQSIFDDLKHKTAEANSEVEYAKKALSNALQKAKDLAEQTSIAAIAAAGKANEDAKRLMDEADSHSKMVEIHAAQIDTPIAMDVNITSN
jgi:hypothetical protein